jgi:hypothetical protein
MDAQPTKYSVNATKTARIATDRNSRRMRRSSLAPIVCFKVSLNVATGNLGQEKKEPG